MKNSWLKEKCQKKINNTTQPNGVNKRKGTWNLGRYTTGKQRNICSGYVPAQISTCHIGKWHTSWSGNTQTCIHVGEYVRVQCQTVALIGIHKNLFRPNYLKVKNKLAIANPAHHCCIYRKCCICTIAHASWLIYCGGLLIAGQLNLYMQINVCTYGCVY